jgi:hypothetical protein
MPAKSVVEEKRFWGKAGKLFLKISWKIISPTNIVKQLGKIIPSTTGASK